MDMMSDIDNLDVMLGNGSGNPIERELAEAIDQSSVHDDGEANMYQRKDYRDFPMKTVNLDKMMLDSPLRPSQMNLISDCLRKWTPRCPSSITK